MFFMFKVLHNEMNGCGKLVLVTSVAFNDSIRALFINDVKLMIHEIDYDYAKQTLLHCLNDSVNILHESVLTDGNASDPTFDPVYESIRLIKENYVS